jgi:hypothetical protein
MPEVSRIKIVAVAPGHRIDKGLALVLARASIQQMPAMAEISMGALCKAKPNVPKHGPTFKRKKGKSCRW